MSAFVVPDNHINELVNFGVAKQASYYFANSRTDIAANPQKIAEKLLAENYRSVNYRYNDDDEVPPITFKRTYSSTLTPVGILKAIDCLDYQCCETDDWKETEAFAILEGIKAAAIRALPGYEDAPWGVR